MDFATFNGLYTLFLIIIFVALIFWAYSKKQKQSFEEMGNSILDDDLDSTEYESNSSEHTGAKK
ncbi:cbb3-type cytochrome c oxidase subunit 3 [Psychromonas sp. RZ22]|uniref:cbb3-type cytochrome oxidase subunit 3 n=1 Tax=Psychromonas algarum TaxID=2555643 RepID=UPI001067C6AB|nr:cbb3-type cytochrome c oxidase subunit 3 [Psychromonas sp. RZ22]TEW53692.1 cbb3-type cytochrome c oxidase subunit 3 [Psychromonas sp. RZ22]